MSVDTMRMYQILKRQVCYMCKPVHKNTQSTPIGQINTRLVAVSEPECGREEKGEV